MSGSGNSGNNTNSSTVVRMYSTLICPYCIRAKLLLKNRGIAFDEISVSGDHVARQRLVQITGRRTVPQIFIGDESIGGFEELRALDRSGELAKKLEAAKHATPSS